mmetsp:Transcript_19515/g.27241  ORF Transcript_19515/g.27241 Transcript_19515/m.27241 type:complete len:145 (-) Transcript_19515:17-451(-)
MQIRTEIYIGFIKQCTENPEPEKVPRVWELLALCLSVFPPGPDFEDYLEAWLRNPEIQASAEKFWLRELLRQAVYKGADTKAVSISENELKDVPTLLKKRICPVDFVWPKYIDDTPSWADLTKSFYKKGASLSISEPPGIVLKK